MTARSEQAWLDTLRRSQIDFESLPDTLSLPGSEDAQTPEPIPLVSATVDDVAFALQQLNRCLSHLVSQIEALRALHDQARLAGARGMDGAVASLASQGGKDA